MLNLKSQSFMDYLTTYGWVVIAVLFVAGALYRSGFFSSSNFFKTECIAQSQYTCQNLVMNTTGYVSFNFGQISNGTLLVTGEACTNSTSQPALFNNNTINVAPRQKYNIVLQCPGIGASGRIGTTFHGYLWIRYNVGAQTALVQNFAIITAVASTNTTLFTTPSSSTTTTVSTTTIGQSRIVLPVSISVQDSGFTPNNPKIVEGQHVALTLYNIGRQPHDLYIPSLGVNTTPVSPGMNKTVLVDMPTTAQNYTFYSTIPADLSAGLAGTLHVVPQGSCGGSGSC